MELVRVLQQNNKRFTMKVCGDLEYLVLYLSKYGYEMDHYTHMYNKNINSTIYFKELTAFPKELKGIEDPDTFIIQAPEDRCLKDLWRSKGVRYWFKGGLYKERLINPIKMLLGENDTRDFKVLVIDDEVAARRVYEDFTKEGINVLFTGGDVSPDEIDRYRVVITTSKFPNGPGVYKISKFSTGLYKIGNKLKKWNIDIQ